MSDVDAIEPPNEEEVEAVKNIATLVCLIASPLGPKLASTALTMALGAIARDAGALNTPDGVRLWKKVAYSTIDNVANQMAVVGETKQ
jgi:hypothetical protein